MNINIIKNNFEKNGFDFDYFETSADALSFLKNNIKDKVISAGGSVTLRDMGIYDNLNEQNEAIHWHWIDQNPNTTQVCDVYMMSANGLSSDGKIVNIDGACNRVSASLYGCSEVYCVCGINKLTGSLDDAIYRARNIAAPKNAKKLCKNTPCAVNADKCYDCDSEDRICRALVVLMKKPSKIKDFHLILINENLGF